MENYVGQYIDKLEKGLRAIDPTDITGVIDTLEKSRIEQKMIFVIGNGGSAATASHMANDLQKLASKGKVPAFRAIALTDNVPLMTAWGNDEDYTAIFVRQLEALASQEDVLIAITGSGNSPNIVRAMKWARDNKLKTIALLGFNGGKARQIADHVLLFAEDHYGRVEDAHMILEHMIANYLAEMS